MLPRELLVSASSLLVFLAGVLLLSPHVPTSATAKVNQSVSGYVDIRAGEIG